MWLTSNTPTSCRTARCSASTPWYCTGISKPANGTMRPPRATCRSCRGVRRSAAATAGQHTDREGGRCGCGDALPSGAVPSPFARDEPLAELHAHLGGSVPAHVMWEVAHQQGIALPTRDYWEFERMTSVSDPR